MIRIKTISTGRPAVVTAASGTLTWNMKKMIKMMLMISMMKSSRPFESTSDTLFT